MEKVRQTLRILIVAEHASSRYGGEAILPLHIFRGLRSRGVDAHLIVHARTRDELEERFADDLGRIHFLPDGAMIRLLHLVGLALPERVRDFSTGLLSRLLTQRGARRIAVELIASGTVNVVHQPIPVAPREPSLLHGLGIPVVMGPLNGGMSYPEAFRGRQSPLVSQFIGLGRRATAVANWLMPGRLKADILLVANERTRDALPAGVRGEVRLMPENGVDVALWHPRVGDRPKGAPLRAIFVGRLIGCKAVDLLLDAFRDVLARTPATLRVVGDGPLRDAWEAKAKALGLDDHVTFLGWRSQEDCAELLRESDVLVLPSLHECGGAVVLEAMAAGLPVVAADWGGPADYLDGSCGILVGTASQDGFVAGLAEALIRLADEPGLRDEMGRAGRERVADDYDWERKIDRLLEVYSGVVEGYPEAEPCRQVGLPPSLSTVL